MVEDLIKKYGSNGADSKTILNEEATKRGFKNI